MSNETLPTDFASHPLDANLLEDIATIAESAVETLQDKTLNHGAKEQVVFRPGDVAALVQRTPAAVSRLYDPRYTSSPLPEPERNGRGHRIFKMQDVLRVLGHYKKLPCQIYDAKGGVKVIAFLNFKGGAGKTVSSTSQAHYLSRKGYRVLLVDMDPQGTATTLSGLVPDWDVDDSETMADVISTSNPGAIDIHQKIRPIENWPGMGLIPANMSLQDAEFASRALIKQHGDAVFQNLKVALSSVRDQYDVIIVDPPPTLGMLSLNSQVAAEGLIVPLQPQMNDLTSTIQALSVFSEQWKGRLAYQSPPQFIRFLLTNGRGTNIEKWCQSQIKAMWNTLVLENAMINSPEVQGAAVQMRTIYELTKPVGDREAHQRARRKCDAVCNEIESLITSTWELR